MTDTVRPWAILVATQHGQARSMRMSAADRRREVRQLLTRALTLAPPLRTCALVAQRFEEEWREFDHDLPAHNVLVQADDLPPLAGITRAVAAIRARDASAHVILIPADHCAAVESEWVASAQGALMLAGRHQDTVYLLHDKPQADSNPFAAATDFCSSTVIVGSTDSLLELCAGNRSTRVIELSTEEPAGQPAAAGLDVVAQAADAAPGPIHLVHVRSVEEYARLQRGDYTKPKPSAVDVRV